MSADQSLRKHILYLLEEGGAHADFDTALKDVPPAIRGKKPQGTDHSLWELLEHMRIAQWDIVEFTRNPKHKSPKFPDGYWPKEQTPPSEKAWEESVKEFREDLKEMTELVESADLFANIPHGDGQTILREVLLVADHNAYHLGQFVQLRKMLGGWE
ncbi:MAG: hypothetical protein JWO13_1553 [Acidobacteriales bacterium]|nr:hypothetical protein [Terriglobales bacterium]